MRALDVNQLRAFVTVADLGSFTAAGEALAATQSAISLRIARLEKALGRQLLARTPRSVSLTPDGERLLIAARRMLAAHDRALATLDGEGDRFPMRFAISDHAAGHRLGAIFASLRASMPALVPEVTLGLSQDMRRLYDAGQADVAVVRQETPRGDGIPLLVERLAWVAVPWLDWLDGEPLPLVSLRGACRVRAAAAAALDAAGIARRDAFLGGSVAALQAAVTAGLGVGVFGSASLPEGCRPLDRGLPRLAESAVVLHTRLTGEVRAALELAFRQA
jgi:DNA-binding transcriptional LysR family regulator